MRHTSLLLIMFCAALPPAAAQTTIQVAPAPTGPGLFGPRTVLPVTVACTDLPTATVVEHPLRIVAPHSGDDHAISRAGDIVVLNGGTAQGFAIGQRYFTRRLTAPVNRERISNLERGAIRTSGWLTVIAADERSTLARIDYACTGIEAGDYLDPYTETVLPVATAARGLTDFSDLGRVLLGVDRREQFGAGELLSIDRGAAHGMTGGRRVAFYRDRNNGTPLFEIGEGIVVEVSLDTSKIAVDWTNQDVLKGDYVGVRRPTP